MARHGKKIHYTHWTGFSISSNALSAGTAAATMFSAAHESETLLRMRGNLVSYLDGTSTPGEEIEMGVGLILVPEGTGTTVLWSPLTDIDAPWIWYERFVLGYEEMVTDVVDVPGITSYRSVIDSKSMRIVRNQEMQCVFENVTLGGAGATNNAVSIRALNGTG